MLYNIYALKALKDNYIWIIRKENSIIVIDPTFSEKVIEHIEQNKLNLTAILLTHSHADHIGGVQDLKNRYNPEIIDNFEAQLEDEQIIHINGFPDFKVLLTPGHTYEHVCYLMCDAHLFCGDTLFSMGCGRVFTGDYPAMYNSLLKIKKLDKNILCYPAHEYTLQNLDFTFGFDDSIERHIYSNIVAYKLNILGNSLPTYLFEEFKYNLFFRCHDKDFWKVVLTKTACKIENELECFTQLRLLRNNF